MTNAEKLKERMDTRDCVRFYCKHHYCGDCPIYRIKSKRNCRELLAEWMEQEAEDG